VLEVVYTFMAGRLIKKKTVVFAIKNMFLPNVNLPYEVDFDGAKTDILKTYQAVPMEIRADQSHQADDSLWVLRVALFKGQFLDDLRFTDGSGNTMSLIISL
jgi:hypothetical protein